MSIKSILEQNNTYTEQLELELLRYFEKLRNEILEGIQETNDCPIHDMQDRTE